jgi:hypothetical protein
MTSIPLPPIPISKETYERDKRYHQWEKYRSRSYDSDPQHHYHHRHQHSHRSRSPKHRGYEKHVRDRKRSLSPPHLVKKEYKPQFYSENDNQDHSFNPLLKFGIDSKTITREEYDKIADKWRKEGKDIRALYQATFGKKPVAFDERRAGHFPYPCRGFNSPEGCKYEKAGQVCWFLHTKLNASNHASNHASNRASNHASNRASNHASNRASNHASNHVGNHASNHASSRTNQDASSQTVDKPIAVHNSVLVVDDSDPFSDTAKRI